MLVWHGYTFQRNSCILIGNQKLQQILIKDIKALLQNICKDDRVKYHIEPVVKSAKNLALKFNADVQVVEIASYLHDVTKITGDRKKHHITGAKYAEDFLSKYNIEEWKVESIKNCIKKHRGLSEYTRDTIEEKIVATADAIAHIEHPLTLFYAWYGKRQCQIDEGADGIINKLQKSWGKIEFEDVKKELEEKYKILMKLLMER